MESVEICKKEIEESLNILRWIADELGDTNYHGAKVINAVEIIDIFTDILIQHVEKGGATME